MPAKVSASPRVSVPMTPYRVSARDDVTVRDREEVLAFSRSVRGPRALPAALVLIVTIAGPAFLYWKQWLGAAGVFHFWAGHR